MSTSRIHSPQQPPYYQKLSLTELGVDEQIFLQHMRPVYDSLQRDPYDVERSTLAEPILRFRALAESIVEKTADGWNCTRVPAQPFVQSENYGNYDRKKPRTYPEVPAGVVEHPEAVQLLSAVSDIIHSVRSDAERMRLIFTFMRIVHNEESSGACTIEEVHSDGMDYVVPALVINRQNLQPESGESSVYDKDRNKLFGATLQPGELILQDDRDLLHNITKIQRESKNEPGIRDVIGIDFHIFPKQ